MNAFRYSRPGTVSAVVESLRREDGARPLAGGMSLLPAMKHGLSRPSALVDLACIGGLSDIRLENGVLRIGALSRHAQVAAAREVCVAIPSLAALAGHIGDRQVRNRGTLGGSLANNDPAACYPAAVLGLDAIIETDRREITAEAFFVDLFETSLTRDEIIVAVRFPVPRNAAYKKFHQPASRFALVGVFVCVTSHGMVRVAVTGAGPVVFRATQVEQALNADFRPESAMAARIPADGLNSDMHGDSEYRAHLVPVLAARAVSEMLGQSGERSRGY